VTVKDGAITLGGSDKYKADLTFTGSISSNKKIPRRGSQIGPNTMAENQLGNDSPVRSDSANVGDEQNRGIFEFGDGLDKFKNIDPLEYGRRVEILTSRALGDINYHSERTGDTENSSGGFLLNHKSMFKIGWGDRSLELGTVSRDGGSLNFSQTWSGIRRSEIVAGVSVLINSNLSNNDRNLFMTRSAEIRAPVFISTTTRKFSPHNGSHSFTINNTFRISSDGRGGDICTNMTTGAGC
jgi:hypothetical protein